MKLLQKQKRLLNHQKQSFSSFTQKQSNLLKLLSLGLLIVGFILFKINYSASLRSICLRDLTHQLLYPINRSMEKDNNSVILLVGQLLIEVPLISLLVYWTVKVKNTRLGSTCMLFYAIRTISLHIFYLPFPDYIVWRQPIVPSFFVPYDRTRDFYFSGHTGIGVVILLQVCRLKLPRWLKAGCWVTIVWIIFMLLASRVHYVIDILGGGIFATVSFVVTQNMVRQLDYFWSLPALFHTKLRQRINGSESSQNNSLLDQQILRK